MKIMIAFALSLFAISLYAKETPDTIQISDQDWMFQSQSYFAVRTNTTKPDEGKLSFKLRIVRKKGLQAVKKGGRPDELTIQDSFPVMASLSDEGTLLLSFRLSEYDFLARCIDIDGNLLWERHFQKPPYDEKTSDMIISPDGKFAMLTASDSCRLISGIDGQDVPSKLSSLVKGDYTAFFDGESKVVVISGNWSIMKFDPEKNIVVQHKEITDPTNGEYRLSLNKDEFITTYNFEKGLLAVPLLYVHRDTAKVVQSANWILVFDTDLNVRILKDLNGSMAAPFQWVENGIIVPMAYEKDRKYAYQIRFYDLSDTHRIILEDDVKTVHVKFASQKGDTIIYHTVGAEKTFKKFNLKSRKPHRISDAAPISANDSETFLRIKKGSMER